MKSSFKILLTLLMMSSWHLNIEAKTNSLDSEIFVTNCVSYEWEICPDREAFTRVNVEAIYECYKNIPFSDLRLDDSIDLKEWAASYIDEFLDNLKNPKNQLCLMTAKKDETPVGYATFDLSSYPSYVYICELVVDPDCQRQGIGKNLVFSVLKHYPETKKLVLVTRKANYQACAFYPAIGFTNSEYMHPGYDPELYTGFEFVNDSESDRIL